MNFDAVMNRTRLIVFSLLSSVVALTAVAFAVRQSGGGNDLPLLIMLASVAALALPAYLIVRRQMTASLRRNASPDDSTVLLGAFQTLTIIGAALAESVGMLAGVVLLISGNLIAVDGSAVSIAGLLASLPTSAAVDSFLVAATGRPREGRWT